MTPEQKFINLYEEMSQLCDQQNWGDPFSYARGKEISAAIKLGHRVAEDLSGADAFNMKGEPLEYKSTIGENPHGSYTGVSVQSTWKKQEKYLLKEKIANYPEHYYNRFDKKNGKLVESWKMKGSDVYRILLPKFKKSYPTVLQKKDPRLRADVTWTEIKKHGTKVYEKEEV